MKQFDVKALRDRVQAIYGAPRDLAKDLDKCRQQGTLAAATTSILMSTTQCLVAGWLDPIPELLAKGEQFALATIAQPPDCTYERAIAYRDLGFCRWLASNQNDADSFSQMAEQYSQYPFKDWFSLEYNLVNLVGGDQYEATVKLVKDSGLQPPINPNDCVKSPHFAYLVAANNGLGDRKSEVAIAIERFITKAVLKDLISNGHWIEGAMWMKIARWTEGSNAHDAVRSCLDFQ